MNEHYMCVIQKVYSLHYTTLRNIIFHHLSSLVNHVIRRSILGVQILLCLQTGGMLPEPLFI
jgi:hypothetical protein